MDLTGRIASLAAMGISSFLAPRLASGAWKLFTGEEPPNEDEGGKFLQIVTFAALSAVFVATIQFFTMRGAKKVLPTHSETHSGAESDDNAHPDASHDYRSATPDA